jgi:hypothetical protein
MVLLLGVTSGSDDTSSSLNHYCSMRVPVGMAVAEASGSDGQGPGRVIDLLYVAPDMSEPEASAMVTMRIGG